MIATFLWFTTILYGGIFLFVWKHRSIRIITTRLVVCGFTRDFEEKLR
jgi:hypothetical protein